MGYGHPYMILVIATIIPPAKCVSENGVSLFEIMYREMGIEDKVAGPVSVQPSGVTLTQPNNTTLLRKAKKMNIVEYM